MSFPPVLSNEGCEYRRERGPLASAECPDNGLQVDCFFDAISRVSVLYRTARLCLGSRLQLDIDF